MSAGNMTPHRVHFSGSLTLRTIDDAHARLLEALRDHDAVEIDCADATEVDISFVQLLIGARRSARISGKSFALVAPAQGPLRRTLDRGGFLTAGDGGASPDDIFWNKGSAAA